MRVAREWEVWAAANLLRGMPQRVVRDRLVEEGLDEAAAEDLLKGIVQSPAFEAAGGVARDARRWAAVGAIEAELHGAAAHPHAVLRDATVDPARFFDLYYAHQVPVVLTDIVRRGFSLEAWDPAALSERFGETELRVTVEREDNEAYARTFHRKTRAMTVRELVERVEASREAPSGDVYLVSANDALANDALQPLVDDISLPSGWMDPERLRAGGVRLWLGPAGTVTVLHQDPANVLFCQLHGRKRWWLVPWLDRGLIERVEAPYTTLCPDELGGSLVKDVVVEAGEALFVPVGWWHHVEALTPSCSVSLTAFPRENAFSLGVLTRPGAS